MSPRPERVSRGLASCFEPGAPIQSLGLSGSLVGIVHDEALKRSAQDYYLFLSQVEASSLAGRQAIRSAYGLGASSFSADIYQLPTVMNFQPLAQPAAGAQGFLWGDIGAFAASPMNVTMPTQLHAPVPGTSVAEANALRAPAASAQLPLMSSFVSGGVNAPRVGIGSGGASSLFRGI